MILRAALRAVSPPGRDARLSVLIFHRVLDAPDPLFPDEIDAARFDTICSWLGGWFNVLPLDEAVALRQARRLPARALAITFDDGYEDNHRVALPILQRHGLTATFFVSTGFLDGSCMWNDLLIHAVRSAPPGQLQVPAGGAGAPGPLMIDGAASRRSAIDAILGYAKYLAPDERREFSQALLRRTGSAAPVQLMMSPEQVQGLHRAGMQIGAHTVSHPILATLSSEAARSEMQRSKQQLEAVVGGPVSLFAYPNGRPGDDYTERDVGLARDCGFAAAFSTVWGAAHAASDNFQLPRFTPWDRPRLRFGARLLHNLATR